MRRLLGYAALLIGGAAVMAASDVARTSSITNRYGSNYTATWTAINKLSFTDAQIAFIQGLTTQQMTFISGLAPAQCTFLANIEQLGIPTDWPVALDSHTGASWATGERDIINAVIDCLNDFITLMQRQHLMS